MPGLTPVAVEFNAADNAVDFSYLSRVTSLQQRSFSAWIYPTSTAHGFGTIFAIPNSTNGGNFIRFYNFIRYFMHLHIAGNPASFGNNWWDTTETLSLNAWHLVVVTHDISVSPATAPLIYLDGVAATVTPQTSNTGTAINELAMHLQIGGQQTGTTSVEFVGKIFDPRVYNRILTPAEITILYNAGTPSATVGLTLVGNQWERNAGAENLYNTSLVFQAFAVMDENTALYIDQDLSGLKLRDATYGYVGTVIGNPIGRAAP